MTNKLCIDSASFSLETNNSPVVYVAILEAKKSNADIKLTGMRPA